MSPRRESQAGKTPLTRTKSEDAGSPKLRRHQQKYQDQQVVFRGTADASDIHICVLCIKALVNNAVSEYSRMCVDQGSILSMIPPICTQGTCSQSVFYQGTG